MPIEAVKEYLSSSERSPFFLAVGDGEYSRTKDKLAELGFEIVRVSDYCAKKDKRPNLDSLRDLLKTADINVRGKKIAVVGLGEYLALQGKTETESEFSNLKNLPIGTAKVVLVLRGVVMQLQNMQLTPGQEKLKIFISDNHDCNTSITLAAPAIGLTGLDGFKALLAKLENGESGNVVVSTVVDLSDSMFTIHKVTNAYDGVKFTVRAFNLPCDCGTEREWKQLLKDLNENGHSLDDVFAKYTITGSLDTDFYTRIDGVEYRNWLFFVALKLNADTIANSYLRYVLSITSAFSAFKTSVLTAIIDIAHTDKRFTTFYAERKQLVKGFPQSDIADFVIKNRRDRAESIYKLTDNTNTEREEIIAWVSQNGYISEIASIYPALAAYLKKHHFNCGELSELLTDYFEAYKRQKLSNVLEADFLKQVDALALTPKYKRLPTRDSILDEKDKANTYLFWLDALGAEYLSYISYLANSRCLSLNVRVARSELPSITTINNGFYYQSDNWKKKNKVELLDDIKHKPDGGYNFEDNKLPIHLARELEVIATVINDAATELALRHYSRVLIVSDHGASRLAVLRRKEEKYDTDEDSKIKGEHSGRCCKAFPDYDLPFAIEENGYLVLADYGRFRGSRPANVEVHGGATLEEVVVPIIELALKDATIKVELVEKSVFIDRQKGITVTLFSETPQQEVSIVVNDKRYIAVATDANHFNVSLPGIKRAKDYPAEIYVGDSLVGATVITAKSRLGGSDSSFDKMFD
jgi:hypothetical protein